MRYGVLSNKELASLAESDPRYTNDQLFTELVVRLDGETRRGAKNGAADTPLLTDAREVCDVR